MKKRMPVFLSAAVSAAMIFSACSVPQGASSTAASTAQSTASAGAQSYNVVVSTFPIYDWVREVTAGDESIQLTLLADNGADPHSFEPTTEDITDILAADLFIYNGGISDDWVEGVFAQDESLKDRSYSFMDMLPASAFEQTNFDNIGDHTGHDHGDEDESHTHDEDESHTHDEDDSHAHDEDESHAHDEDESHTDDAHEGHDHSEYDEHVWLSLENAIEICEELADILGDMNEAGDDAYEDNAQSYIDKLDALHEEYKAAVEASAKTTMIFGDRFPFHYLLGDYGIDYYAAFDGCSAETEASFETVTYLAGRADEVGAEYILTTDGQNEALAQTIIEASQNPERTTLMMHSLQSVTQQDLEEGLSYISVMQQNLEVLRQALGSA